MERSDRMWSTGKGNGKPLQYSCLENPMKSMKRQNDRTLKEELPRSVGAQYTPGKRNPSKMIGVARGYQRADTLKPYSQKTSQSNHTRITALSNSVKLSHAVWGHPRRVMLERSDRMWSTGEKNVKPLQYSCLRTP